MAECDGEFALWMLRAPKGSGLETVLRCALILQSADRFPVYTAKAVGQRPPCRTLSGPAHPQTKTPRERQKIEDWVSRTLSQVDHS